MPAGRRIMYRVLIWDFVTTVIHSRLKMGMFIHHYPRVLMPAIGHLSRAREKSKLSTAHVSRAKAGRERRLEEIRCRDQRLSLFIIQFWSRFANAHVVQFGRGLIGRTRLKESLPQ